MPRFTAPPRSPIHPAHCRCVKCHRHLPPQRTVRRHRRYVVLILILLAAAWANALRIWLG